MGVCFKKPKKTRQSFLSPRKTGAQQGFTLVELMVVVAIIGMLSSMAVPRFQKFMGKARQAEAKTNLSAIYSLQFLYHGDNGTYYPNNGFPGWVTDLNPIGFQVVGTARYTYYAQSGTNAFNGAANANSHDLIVAGCGSMDQWFSDENGAIWATNDCTKR